MSRFKLLYFVIFIISLYNTNAQISDKRLCVDTECKVPISLAKTLLRYSSPDSRILSFAPNADTTIYSKSAGSREDLWGAEINGRRGYVPKRMVREFKVLQKPSLLVDTEPSNDTQQVPSPGKVEPDKVRSAYEVVDGTTIYLSPQDAIAPSSTESPVRATTAPQNEPEEVEPEKTVVDDVLSKLSNWINEADEDGGDDEGNDNDEEEDVEEAENDSSDAAEDAEAAVPEATELEIEPKPEENVKTKDESEVAPEAPETPEPDENVKTKEGTKIIPASSVENSIPDDKVADPNPGKPKLTTFSAKIDEAVLSQLNDLASADDAFEEKQAATVDNQEEILKTVQEQVSDLPPVQSSNENIVDVPVPPIQVPDLADSALPPPIPPLAPQENHEASTPPAQDKVPGLAEASEIEPLSAEEILKSIQSDAANTKEPDVDQVEPLAGSTEEAQVQSSTEAVENSAEAVASAPEEATTAVPELEAPQPEALEAVTPNPGASHSTPEDVAGTLSPLVGLFSNSIDSGGRQDHGLTETQDQEPQIGVYQTRDDVADEPSVVENSETNEGDRQDSSNEAAEEIAAPEVQSNQEDFVQDANESSEAVVDDSPGVFSQIYSLFGGRAEEGSEEVGVGAPAFGYEKGPEGSPVQGAPSQEDQSQDGSFVSDSTNDNFPDANEAAPFCHKADEPIKNVITMDVFTSDFFLYLATTAVSVIVFLFGYIAFDKSKREGPLVARINKLEKELLIVVKENQMLQDGVSGDGVMPNELAEGLKRELEDALGARAALEDQVQSLEKELENSTEVGMELNRMLSEILSSQNGSDVLKANVEHLQRRLVEQQATINSVNETLAIASTENHELKLDLELSNKKVVELQAELDKMCFNILKIEGEKDQQQAALEKEVDLYRHKLEEAAGKSRAREDEISSEIGALRRQLGQTERDLELRTKELIVLKDAVKELKGVKNSEGALKSLLDVGEMKAELLVLKNENQRYSERLQQEAEAKVAFEKRAQAAAEEAQRLRQKYDEADTLKVESQTKLEVLSNYFKDKEAQLQKEISKHESMWVERQGEATSTTERIRFMQEQLQNYKAQNESLKQEILSQEVELKSQISVLEKKAHENWVSVRQAERKLEDAKQEAAQLRHRLTQRERALQDEKFHRLQSPIEQNGEIPISPLHAESPASPPLLFGVRDHITKSPALPGLPPFLPPPGAPFMPPPPLHGVPPFIHPPPTLFPVDHRPPPLGRMSSPPVVNSRYSPSSRGYSPYDRNSSSPSDSEYGTSPPHHHRGYSPYSSRNDGRRDYKRPPPIRSNGRNVKGGASSGSGNSNESLEKINRQQSKV